MDGYRRTKNRFVGSSFPFFAARHDVFYDSGSFFFRRKFQFFGKTFLLFAVTVFLLSLLIPFFLITKTRNTREEGRNNHVYIDEKIEKNLRRILWTIDNLLFLCPSVI
mgnify:CR=1 FL=1